MSNQIGRRHDANIDRILEIHPQAKDPVAKSRLESELLDHSPRRIANMRKRLEKTVSSQQQQN